MKFIITLLLVCNLAFCQEFEYDYIEVRDEVGEFISIGKSGKFNINDSEIELFDQVLKITSKRIIFDEKRNLTGNLYGCTDGTYVYAILLTSENILYFYTKEDQMLKFNLVKIKNGNSTDE